MNMLIQHNDRHYDPTQIDFYSLMLCYDIIVILI